MSDQVILCNFGGPQSREEVEPFLVRLFEDPFIIRAPLGSWLRSRLARRIAKKRAPASTHEYEKIGFSPINRLTNVQAQQLAQMLNEKRPGALVHVVNRYTRPFAEEVIPQLGPGRIFVITLYPHFCHSTVATSMREVDKALRARFGEQERTTTRIFSWWHNATYLDYCAAQLRNSLQQVMPTIKGRPLTIMFSAHGIPKRYRDRGDPYVTETTAHFHELKRRVEPWLTKEFGSSSQDWQLCYQSRVGPVEWTKPYTDATIAELGKTRGGHLLIYPVSFTSDHIETLFEMDVTYKNLALEAGFSSYSRVTPPNEDPEFTRCIVAILEQHGF